MTRIRKGTFRLKHEPHLTVLLSQANCAAPSRAEPTRVGRLHSSFMAANQRTADPGQVLRPRCLQLPSCTVYTENSTHLILLSLVGRFGCNPQFVEGQLNVTRIVEPNAASEVIWAHAYFSATLIGGGVASHRKRKLLSLTEKLPTA